MPHSRFYRTFSLAFVLATCLHGAGARGDSENTILVAASAWIPQEQNEMIDQPDSADSKKTARLDWSGNPCDTVSRLPELVKLSVTEIEKRLGPPKHKQSFRLGERQDEFHIALQNTYPLTVPENANVELQEWNWSEGDCCLTVWLHRVKGEWQSFENLRWHQATDF